MSCLLEGQYRRRYGHPEFEVFCIHYLRVRFVFPNHLAGLSTEDRHWILLAVQYSTILLVQYSTILLVVTSTMVKDISYNTISYVIESWEQLRRIKDYDEVAGMKLFQR